MIKALPVATRDDLAPVDSYAQVADMLLFDAKPAPGAALPGGNGLAFDHTLVAGLDPGVPVMLSGGLDPATVAQAIGLVRPAAVDVSSGVERAPGDEGSGENPRLRRGGAGRGCGCTSDAIGAASVTVHQPNSFRTGPDERGRFGNFGGRFVAETLMPLILELEEAYAAAKADPAFRQEMDGFLAHYVGRPSALYFAERLTEHFGGAKIYLKREELNHTGSHKVNNVLGQILLARRMGKKRIIAETGAGQHGVATATLCARFGLDCVVYMGAVDVERQKPNVFRMKLLGAEVVPVQSGTRTLKDAMNEALRDWVTNVETPSTASARWPARTPIR